MSTSDTWHNARPVYAVDLDGVVFDANASMVALVNHAYGTAYQLADITEYDWYAWCDAEHARHALAGFRALVPSMPFLHGALTAVHRLAARGHLHVLTHRTPDLTAATAERLAALPIASIHHVDRARDKADLARELGCSVALEDSPSQALAYAAAGLHVYLFDYAYNRRVEDRRIQRVRGWAEVVAAELAGRVPG